MYDRSRSSLLPPSFHGLIDSSPGELGSTGEGAHCDLTRTFDESNIWTGRIKQAWGRPLRSGPSFDTCWLYHSTFGELHGTSSDQMNLLLDQSISFRLRRPTCGALCPLRCPNLEPVFELARDLLHRSHSAGSSRLSPLSFHAPIVCYDTVCQSTPCKNT